LPINFCRTRAKVDGVYQVQFDVRYFDSFRDMTEKQLIFAQFPKEFLEMYLLYKDGNLGGREPWFFDLSPEFAMCFQFDDFGIPFFVGIFEDLTELVEYKALEKVKTKMELKKLVVQKLPMDDKTGEVLLELTDAQALHRNLIEMLKGNDYVDGVSSPCPVQVLNLQDNSNKTQRDNIGMAENSVFNSAGISQSVLNATNNLSFKVSVQNDEAISLRLLDMYKRWLDNKLEYLIPSGNYYYEIFFPPITVYNRDEKITEYTSLIAYGYPKLPLVVATGIKQSTFMNMLEFENSYLKLQDKMIPAMSSHTQTTTDGGRPESDEADLSDSGVGTRANGDNEGRA
jgi:hypothetical protein